MGDQFEVTSWAAVPLNDKAGLSARIAYTGRNAVSGSMMTNLTDKHRTLWSYAGANFLVGGHRFAVEAGIPLWQDKGANALDMGISVTVGWQKAF